MVRGFPSEREIRSLPPHLQIVVETMRKRGESVQLIVSSRNGFIPEILGYEEEADTQ